MTKKKVLMVETIGLNTSIKVGSHHYAEHFVKAGYDVCWITHPISPFHRLSHEFKKYALELQDKFNVWRHGGVYQEGIFYYAPMTLLPYTNYPILNSAWVLRNTLKCTFPNIRRFLRKKGFESVDILWFSNPALFELKNFIKHKHSVFRISDDHAEFETIPDDIINMINGLVQESDNVFVISKNLMKKYEWAGEKIHYLPNGVDFDHFNKADPSLPADYNDIPSPRIVYVGSIAEWFDVELIKKAAQILPACSFVLIGEPRIDLSMLRSCQNVHILGPRNYNVIPPFLKNADIGIIPFKRTRLIESVSPIKLYEYLSCGIPVVSTKWKVLEDISSPALLADSQDEFINLLQQVLAQNKDKQTYIEYAQNNTWGNRFDHIMEVLERTK